MRLGWGAIGQVRSRDPGIHRRLPALAALGNTVDDRKLA